MMMLLVEYSSIHVAETLPDVSPSDTDIFFTEELQCKNRIRIQILSSASLKALKPKHVVFSIVNH